MRKCLGSFKFQVRSSGAIVQGQLWDIDGEEQVFMDENYYPSSAFKIIPKSLEDLYEKLAPKG